MTDLATIGFKADTRELVTAEKRLDSLAKQGDRTEKSIDGMNKALGAAGAVIATLGIANATQEVIKYSDSWTMVTNQLRQVTSGTEDLFLTQQKVVDLAKETRTNLEATTELYTGLSRSTESLGKTQEEVLAVTGTLNKLFLVGGKSAEEAAGAILQLNQGLSAGALRGDEFNSVAEGAPRILDALSSSLNIAKGDLKDFAATGGITAEILFKALEDYENTADQMASKVERTYAQSLEVARTNTTKFVGESELLRDSTMALGNAFVFASENIEPIIAGLGAAGAVLVASTIPSMASYVSTLAAATAGTNALTLATRVLLGPIGLTVAALGAAATAFSIYKDDIDEASEASDKHAEKIAKLEKVYSAMTKSQLAGAYADAQRAAIKADQKRIELSERLAKAIDKERESNKRNGDARSKATNVYTAQVKSLEAEIAKLDKESKEYKDTLDTINAVLTGNIQSLQNWKGAGSEVVKVTKEMSLANRSLADGFNAQILSIKNQKEELRLTADEFEEYQAIQEAIAYGAGPEMIKVLKEQIKQLQAQRKEISKEQEDLRKAGDAATEWAKVTDRAIDSVDAAFVDVIMNIDDGFGDLFDNLENAFKRMIAEMLVQAARADIAGALTGGGGGFSNLSGLLGGNNIGSALSGLGGVFGGASGFSNLQFGAAAGLGGLLGSTAGGSGGIGGSIGASIGLAAGGPIGAAVGSVLGGTVGSLFGGKFELADQKITLEIIGDDFEGEVTTREKKKKLFKNRYRTTTESIEDDVLDVVFSELQDSIISAASLLDIDSVTSTTTKYVGGIDAATGEISRAFEAITTSTTMGVEDWLDNFSSSIDFDTKGLSQEEIQAKIADWADRTSEAMIEGVFGNALNDLAKEGETSTQALQRVVASVEVFNSVSESLGLTFDSTKTSLAEVASSVVDLSGGLQNFAALSESYYQNFFSEEERRLMSTEQLTDAFNELGFALPGSADEFRNIVESIDLTTESGQQLYASLLALNPALAQLIDSTARAAEEAERAAEREAQQAARQAELKAREAEALANKELDLRIQLLQLQGSEEEALALIRERQLENLDPSLRALMQEIFAEQELAKAREEAAAAAAAADELARKEADLRIQLLQVQGKEEEALLLIRQRQLENLDPALQALMLEIYAEEDLAKAREEATRAAEEAKNAEISRLNELFNTLTSNLNFAKSQVELSRDAELERISILERKSKEKYNLEIDSIKQSAKTRKDALAGEQRILSEQLSIVSSVSSSLGIASRGFTSEQALNAAKRGDFTLAQNIRSQDGSFDNATSERIAKAREAFNLAEIGSLADAEKQRLNSQLSLAQMQIDAVEFASQREIEAAKEQLELDKKAYEEQKQKINEQINELLGIDTSVMSLEAATALYNKEQQALLELDYENQLEAIKQAEIQADIQREQVSLLNIDSEIQSAALSEAEAQTEMQAEQVSQLELANASLSAIVSNHDKIIISPPWIEESSKNNDEMIAELRKMREQLNNANIANIQIAQNTAKTANTVRNIEYQNEGQL